MTLSLVVEVAKDLEEPTRRVSAINADATRATILAVWVGTVIGVFALFPYIQNAVTALSIVLAATISIVSIEEI